MLEIEIFMKHIHLFRNVGGGCGPSDCDDTYECECGAKFIATTRDSDVHFAMPKYIAGKDIPDAVPPTMNLFQSSNSF